MFDATGRISPMRGEQRLLLAVLENAVVTFERYVAAFDTRGRRLFAEVEAWFASEDTEWMFSFVAVCNALDFDATYVRAGLRGWRDRHGASVETRAGL
jgi:hypothetical protein